MHNDNITLAPAAEADIDYLVALRIAAMRESLERLGRFDPERARSRFVSGFDPGRTRHILLDGVRVGFVVVKPVDAGLLLDHLYIANAFQRQGIGATVLERIFREADQAGLALQVGALRGSASNRFYQRHGFQYVEESEWDIYYQRPAHAS